MAELRRNQEGNQLASRNHLPYTIWQMILRKKNPPRQGGSLGNGGSNTPSDERESSFRCSNERYMVRRARST
jgi:hypothetical protein